MFYLVSKAVVKFCMVVISYAYLHFKLKCIHWLLASTKAAYYPHMMHFFLFLDLDGDSDYCHNLINCSLYHCQAIGKFHKNWYTFWVVLLTDKQTNDDKNIASLAEVTNALTDDLLPYMVSGIVVIFFCIVITYVYTNFKH